VRRRLLGARSAGLVRRPGPAVAAVVLAGFAAVAVLAPLLADPADLDVSTARFPPYAPPSLSTPLGTDYGGRPILALLVAGTRASMTVGFAAALIAVSLGTAAGIAAGHFGRWTQFVLNRVTEWFLSIPSLPLAIALGAVLGGGELSLVLAIALGMWPAVARIVRAQTLVIEARPYVDRARALGGGHLHVAVRHVVPGVAPVVAAIGVLLIPEAILAAATLSFLGIDSSGGLSWGGILRQAIAMGGISSGAWWYAAAPGVAITALALAVTVCGRHLERRLQPGAGRR
jgi:peptide/nickel transport system permease protein